MAQKEYRYAIYLTENVEKAGGLSKLQSAVENFNKNNGTSAKAKPHKNGTIINVGNFETKMKQERFEVICEDKIDLKAEYVS